MQIPEFIEFKTNKQAEDRNWHPFSRTEMVRRWTSLRQLIEDEGLDALILFNRENGCYSSGYLRGRGESPQCVYVDKDHILLITAKNDAERAWRVSFLNLAVYDQRMINGFSDTIIFILQEHLNNRKNLKIGIDFRNLPDSVCDKLNHQFPKLTIQDMRPAINIIKRIKSREELDHLRFVASSARYAARIAMKTIRPNLSEQEARNKIIHALEREIGSSLPFAELEENDCRINSGEQNIGPNSPVTGENLNAAYPLCLTISPNVFGYGSQLKRTLFLNDFPSSHHERIWQKLGDIHAAAMALLSPHRYRRDLANAIDSLYNRAGLKPYQIGYYGIEGGIQTLESLSNPAYRLLTDEKLDEMDEHDLLQPGMVLSMGTMVFIPPEEEGAGFYAEQDTLIITENGAENITLFPFGTRQMVIESEQT